MQDPTIEFMRRRAAGAYLQARFGIASYALLGKLASTGGGPKFHKAGRTCLYRPADLDAWARSQISETAVASTAELREAAQ